MGRRAISTTEKIPNVHQRQICFTKRRHGLFNKARQLALRGCFIAIVVFSDYGNCFTFAHPNVTTVAYHFRSRRPLPPLPDDENGDEEETESDEDEEEEEKKTLVTKGKLAKDWGYWWNSPINEMALEESEEFLEFLEGLDRKVARNLDVLQLKL